MAKSSRHRPMPSSPQYGPTPSLPASEAPGGTSVPTAKPAQPAAPQAPEASVITSRPAPFEKPHVVAGTGCTAGHERGKELDAERLGAVPSQKRSRIGFGLVLWCVVGVGMLAAIGISSWAWARLAAEVALLWLAFAAVMVRRAGHRGRCWRTRTWRHAWGGLAPGS